ncbi:hypothetical protein AAFF_G00071620 [Aldrovandia affinis]|uniref:Uncharacterized protein n=1 Tax=Aldrovandia affinis TaxID=143900 RepID=A0AAD7RZA6_9TELE|nr:hypothetical protein AAFF_G00071620 [Aldrovandia affinis]
MFCKNPVSLQLRFIRRRALIIAGPIVLGLCLPGEKELKWGRSLLVQPVHSGATSSCTRGQTSCHGATLPHANRKRPQTPSGTLEPLTTLAQTRHRTVQAEGLGF